MRQFNLSGQPVVTFPDPPTEPCPYCGIPTRGWPYLGGGFMGPMWFWSFVCTTCLGKYAHAAGFG